nr:glycerate kinase [Pseudothermotoga lettingae]
MVTLREDALKIVNETIKYLLPDSAVTKTLRELNLSGNIILVAIGKAAWRMAKAAKDTLGEKITRGVVITKYGHSEGEIDDIEIYEAAHPVPDENTIRATERALKIVQGLSTQDTVLFLVSGGGSALFEKPKGNISLQEIQQITEKLLKSGANIVEINTIRKHLSDVKGGRFAQKVYPARIISLVLSDVLGDRLDSIASGPAYPDMTTSEQAIDILKKYNVVVPDNILQEIMDETPKELKNVKTIIIGSVKIACEKASEIASKMGYNSMILTTSLDCEAKEAGRFISSIAREILSNERPIKRPSAVILGGETVVHVKGSGKGGRNQELAFSAAIGIEGLKNVVICSVGTDGTDGPTDAAGGIVDGETCRKIRENGFDPEEFLKNNDSYNALRLANSLVFTGPTGTNVNDLIVILVG